MRTLAAVVLALLLATVPSAAQASGDGAREARRQLDRLGCDAGRPTTRDPHTRAAVVRFQAANGLHQSGRLTARTRHLLVADRADRAVRCDRRPVPASGDGRRVVVSQGQNYVWLVRADGSVRGQGGMVDDPRELRAGSYTVGSLCGRRAKIRMNTDYSGRLWLPYFTRFANCGVGFHRIPLARSTGAPIHPEWLLGTDARTSSGCLRLSQRLARQLWRFAGVGTRVVVRR
ncbi:L,D-transpeptidase family protein [Nocardioides iriomotensis]|uniref:Peptidoglycan-binding protein n=1 Tax=Nocardioides iriomotensis TaxID=715784 RepID=A0A4Q5IV53_9ACTN|nr:L,D-transpeptidase family protein [Nocardioides iriomotensis]RYU08831.1 peptidoglycan-binding protein [Nocardioides iriomotensis]